MPNGTSWLLQSVPTVFNIYIIITVRLRNSVECREIGNFVHSFVFQLFDFLTKPDSFENYLPKKCSIKIIYEDIPEEFPKDITN